MLNNLMNKNQSNWIAKSVLKFAIVISIFCVAFQPKHSSPDAYEAFTPIYAIEKNSDIAKKIRTINAKISETDSGRLVHYAKKWGEEFGIEPSLLLGVMFVESTFNKYAISNMGARGLMQVLPKWHKDKIYVAEQTLGKSEINDPEMNIYLGAWILKDCQNKHRDVSNSLKCYNGSVGKKTDYHKKVLNGKRQFDLYI